MEKKHVLPVEAEDLPIKELSPPPLSSTSTHLRWAWFILLTLNFLLFSPHFLPINLLEQWTLPPPGINWSPCGEGIDCGHLSVPLDYHNLNLGTANLAVARYRAINDETKKLGTIFLNPGGPGGSGVSFLYRTAAKLSAVLDERYDFVSWDPRGVNKTTPRVECFDSQSDQDLYYFHTVQETGLEFKNLSDPIDLAAFTASVRRADARNAALASRCHEKSGETLKHVGTATVVRDLEYLSRVIQGGDVPVNYWGFSYGTVIGSYFVNMFPDRVGRVIIDGVVDPVMWADSYSVEWYKDDFADAETKTFAHFVRACQEAGPSRCHLASSESTAEIIVNKIEKFLDDLYDYPLAVTSARRPGILTSGMVKSLMFQAMYAPRNWPSFAENLAAAMNGNGTALMNSAQRDLELDNSVKPQTAQAITAVTCVDTPAVPDDVTTDVALQKYVDEVVMTYERSTRKFAAVDLDLCHHWKARETERFIGPFNSSLANTILIIGNTGDPITPVKNAKAVNSYLPNDSRLLVQDGSGHCSTAMASLCTGKVIRGYFLDGELPPNGLVCPTSEKLFPPPENSTISVAWMAEDILNAEDITLMKNMKSLGEEMAPFLMSNRR